ncbi:MAG: hypothetical protein WCH75_27090 [Candidatus Binatia bacterium]
MKSVQSKRIQGIVTAVAIVALVVIAVVLTRDNTVTNDAFTNPQDRPESGSQGVTGGGQTRESGAGESVFSLPEASPDFLGGWHGTLRATKREPPNWGAESNDFGTGFVLDNGQVVMRLAMWAPPGAKITRLVATGLSAKHVRVEDDLTAKDSLGAPLWVRERYDIVLSGRDRIDCTETVIYYRDPNFAKPVARVEYRGTLKRTGEAEMRRHVEDMERRGMKKQAETQTAVPNR